MLNATRAAHRGLNHHPLLVPLVSNLLDPADYAQALAALFGPHSAIESLLADKIPAADFPPRLPDLAADLAQLGIAPLTLAHPLPPATSVADWIGYMYVIEGSNLGGTLIARQLSRSLPECYPRAFFAHSGGAPRWEKFWQFAAAHSKPEEHLQICNAAWTAFEFYQSHLDQCIGSPRPTTVTVPVTE